MFHLKGELEHKRVKRFYARTNKTKTFVTQIAKHLRRERILRKIFQRVKHQAAEKNPLSSNVAANSSSSLPSHQPQAPSIPFEQSDPLPLTPPELHHHISNTQQFYENIPWWLDLHDGDVALIVCSFRLMFPSKYLMPFLRTSSPSLKIICYHSFWDTCLMGLSQLLPTMSATLWK